MKRWIRRLATLLGVLMATVGAARSARAQDCRTREVRTAPDSVAGAYIRSISVRTDSPIGLPIVGSRLSGLRRQTMTSVVARQLLFAPGQRADSGRIGETLRRLRDQRLYTDVALTISRCTTGDTVDLALTTRDAWTLRPIARVVPPSTVSVGFEDRNLLGSARQIAVSDDHTTEGKGGSVSATDPWLFNTSVVGSGRFSDVAGIHMLRAQLRNHEYSVFDRGRFTAAYGRQTFGDQPTPERPLASEFILADAGRVVDSTPTGVTLVYLSAGRDRGDFVSQRTATGLTENQRDFKSADIGVQVRTARFDTVSWFAAGRGFLDIPTGGQGDLLVGAGPSRTEHQTALHYDAWFGRMLLPTRGTLLSLDAWASGFVGPVQQNHTDRASLSMFSEAPHGFWDARVFLEQMLEMDPDLRPLSLANIATDPSYSATPVPMRSANRALAANVERSFHLRQAGRASMLDAALFTAGSMRWDIPGSTEHFALGVVGARLRYFSANGSATSTRIDLAYPVASNGSVVHRLLLSVSLSSLLDAPHIRDGRRRQQ